MTKNFIQNSIQTIIVLIVLFLFSFFFFRVMPRINTQNRVEKVARAAAFNKTTEYHMNDSWGNLIIVESEEFEQGVAYRATSYGRDGKPGTEDDLSHISVDWNKSKLVGKWVGKKAKGVMGGIWEGLKE